MYARGYRSLVTAVLALVGIAVFFFVYRASIAYVSGPTFYDGDRVDTRKCRQCDGVGRGPEVAEMFPETGDRCPFCRGTGLVEVILPGPNRPSRLWGAVIDLEGSDDAYAWGNPPNIRMLPLQTAFLPPQMREMAEIQGGLSGALVRVERPGDDPIEVKSDPTGRFMIQIAPGTYTLTVSKNGFESLSETIDIEPLSEPIWLEKATLIEERDEETARSEFGLSCLVALVRPGEEEAFVRVEAAAH